MYTATMRYYFKAEYFEQACEVWNSVVMSLARKQPGFIRMQFLVNKEEAVALAIGTWKTKEDAWNFMKTGVFKELLTDLGTLSVKTPEPEIWNLKYFGEK
ncbi:MAG: antibiotic biosynthesis monooxygenase [Candidatus Cloacimonetes bacterium]|nr:antibiotic biosynthesis monooxygenase [Candidatus Cloacimonadota bacterium]